MKLKRGHKNVRKCPFHGTCANIGTIQMWGCVTHKHIVRVCKDHEEIYRDYGWIRVRKYKKYKK